MTQVYQKKKEESHFTLFRELFKKKIGQDFPSGQIVECENPDFLIKRSQGWLGIEITDLVRRKHPNAEFSAAEEAGFVNGIVQRAKHLCEQSGVPPLWVTVWIIGSLGRVRGRDARRKLSQNLANLVKQWSDANPGDSDVCLKPGDELPEVYQVGIFRGTLQGEVWLQQHNWKYSPGAVCVAPLSVDDLRLRIVEKESSYRKYLTKCRVCWLLIVGDPCDPAKGCDVRLNPEVASYIYRSSFDRVFLLQLLDELVEFKLLR